MSIKEKLARSTTQVRRTIGIATTTVADRLYRLPRPFKDLESSKLNSLLTRNGIGIVTNCVGAVTGKTLLPFVKDRTLTGFGRKFVIVGFIANATSAIVLAHEVWARREDDKRAIDDLVDDLMERIQQNVFGRSKPPSWLFMDTGLPVYDSDIRHASPVDPDEIARLNEIMFGPLPPFFDPRPTSEQFAAANDRLSRHFRGSAKTPFGPMTQRLRDLDVDHKAEFDEEPFDSVQEEFDIDDLPPQRD